MNWNNLLSAQRLGQPIKNTTIEDSRTQFQRDYDRIIFSGPFRRLQNKTQVFPLPGSVFVHNRLTHSIEVASVGRSLSSIIYDRLSKIGIDNPLMSNIGAAVSAACLAHDMGNPPFGHSGEDAIKTYFTSGNGRQLKDELSDAQWHDFTFFDGNANAFRLLTHQFNGRRPGGFVLTYTMLASIVKYPYESLNATKPKFGFFQSEKEIFREIANTLGLRQINDNPLKYARHPLVYMVEAADDICYEIMDIEDAHKLKILSHNETCELFLNFFDETDDKNLLDKVHSTLKLVTDKNEQISYLRALVIGRLVNECVDVFFKNYDDIMSGQFEGSLIKQVSPSTSKAFSNIVKVSIEEIYADQSVVEIEMAGYRIISTLLDTYVDATLNGGTFGRKLLEHLPEQFKTQSDDTYTKVQCVIDYVSGMTDVYALDQYRKITGIAIPGIR